MKVLIVKIFISFIICLAIYNYIKLIISCFKSSWNIIRESQKLKKESNVSVTNVASIFIKSFLKVTSEENLHLRQKDKYIELMEIFLNNKIDAENFSFYFIAKYDNINQTLREMQQDFEKKFDELSNLLIENKNKKCQIGMSLMWMYDHCDDFDPNSNSSITDEENLRNYAKMLLYELKRA